jgi:lysophospholipase L1-like esterase
MKVLLPTIALMLAFGTLPVAAPAIANPAPDPASQPASGSAPDNTTGLWEPNPRIQDLTVPGTGRKVKPFADMKAPTVTALPGFESSQGIVLDPSGTAEKVKTQDGPEDPPEPMWCVPRIAKSVSVQRQSLEPTRAVPDPQGDSATVDYFGDLTCNFYLYSATGVAGVVDRTPRFERTLHMADQFAFSNGFYGASSGVFSIPGERYDGGRTLEVLFELFLYHPTSKWGACPGPQVVVYVCDGLGTPLVHLILGSDTFGSGLNPPVVRQVNLGDSYASGNGAGAYDSFPAFCNRSANSYTRQLNGRRNLTGLPLSTDERACLGAQSIHLTQFQPGNISGLSTPEQNFYLNRYTTRLVTISMGGNDLGFAPKLLDCLSEFTDFCGGWGETLVTPTDLQVTQANLTTHYRTILSSIRLDGQLVVLTYPRVFPRANSSMANCPFLIRNSISSNELLQLDRAWTAAQQMIINAARAVGGSRIRVVDMLEAFSGHDVCSTEPWVRGIVDPITGDFAESFHPNADGHAEYARRIAQSLMLT